MAHSNSLASQTVPAWVLNPGPQGQALTTGPSSSRRNAQKLLTT